MEKSNFVQQVENHLKQKNALIAVTQNGVKLTKPNTKHQKYSFSLQDVLAASPTVEDFIKSLPSKGFTSGAVMAFRFEHGTTTRLVSETKLTFNDVPAVINQPVQDQTTPVTNTMNPQLANPDMTPTSTPSNNANAAMGFTQIPQYELISLKVQQERYLDLVEKLKQAEKDRDKAESDYRIEKEKAYGLERKLELIEDKHELKLERELNNKKSFLDSETGQQVIGAMAGNFDKILAALRPQQAAIAMGNPLANLSTEKQQFAQQLAQLPDELITLLEKVSQYSMNSDEFYKYVSEAILTYENQTNQPETE